MYHSANLDRSGVRRLILLILMVPRIVWVAKAQARKETVTDQEGGIWDFVIHAYTWQQAVADGVLAEFGKDQWPQMTNGRPVLVTASLREQFDDAELGKIFNDYVHWVRTIRDTLPEEDQMFSSSYGNVKIWVIDDGVTITLLRPEDY